MELSFYVFFELPSVLAKNLFCLSLFNVILCLTKFALFYVLFGMNTVFTLAGRLFHTAGL